MRTTTPMLMLLLLLAASAARAGDREATLLWVNNDRTLAMRNGDDGVAVTIAKPAPLHGLQAGDRIVAVGDEAVPDVEAFTAALERHRRSPATLRVQRDGKERLVRWSAADVRALLPTPPKPPTPPMPPAPPQPPRH
ncbi:PDZ domain-containing protein [Lysobacter yangpyeongensis]